MKTTFPHLGNFYIPFRSFLLELGLEPVIPPFTTGRTIALGTKLAPEFACFPFKVNLGNYIEAIASGAELILMVGGIGPCRLGYYGALQQEILREAGFGVEMVLIEAPKTHPRQLYEKIRRYIPRHRPVDLARAFRIFWSKAKALDEFDQLVNQIRPRARNPAGATKLQTRFYDALDQADGIRRVRQCLALGIEELAGLPGMAGYEPLRLDLVGEIYMVLEPRVNFGIETLLGEMRVEIERTIHLTEWIKEHVFYSIFKPDWSRTLRKLAEPYLQYPVGGHGMETIAHTVAAGVNRRDGAIHLTPFTCMPEIVAMQAIPAVRRDFGIPVLSLIVDEHSSEAGVLTRIEAFIDLLRRKQNAPLPAAPELECAPDLQPAEL